MDDDAELNDWDKVESIKKGSLKLNFEVSLKRGKGPNLSEQGAQKQGHGVWLSRVTVMVTVGV